MNLFGIFDKLQNYKLIRYSTVEQANTTYQVFDYPQKTFRDIEEVCIPNVPYSEENIGKNYDINTGIFS
jgi:hypothetical protein